MKAREHLAVHLFVIFVIIILEMFYDKDLKFYSFFSNIYNGETILVFLFGIGLYLLGAILPDSDSEDKGSYIYYTPFSPLAHMISLLECPLSKMLKMKKQHRGALHTITGILISSIVVVFLLLIIYYWLISNSFSIFVPIFWFICLSIGQLFHLVEDYIKDRGYIV